MPHCVMDPNLDPSIHRQLTAFRSRWRGLLFGRGLCITLLVLLGGLLLLLAVDVGLSMNQESRFWAGGLIYGTVLVVFIIVCIWRPMRLPDERGLATLMEKADPDLREDLLSAVELSNVEAGEGHDSARFRELLREDVAGRMAKVYVPDILPVGLLKRWLTFALILAGVMAIVSLVPASRNHLLRVAMPWWVDIGSAASSHIVLLDPADHDNITAPRNEKLPVLIEINGIELHENPYLETDDGEGNVRMVVMNNDPDGNATMRFVSSVKMEASEMRFRFHAGKHETKWFTANAQEPPVITAFTKEYIYPDYTGLPPKVHEKEGGEISVLQGSEVDLTIHLDQPVKSAELQVQFPDATNILDLLPANPADPLEHSARFTVSTNGFYSIKLVAANGRPNRDADQYPIEAIPDERPTIVISDPKSPKIKSRFTDNLEIQATASDDVNLKGITVDARRMRQNNVDVNSTIQLPELNLPDTNASFTVPIDLLKLDTMPEDIVEVYFNALDVNDQNSTLASVKITVVSMAFDDRRFTVLEPKRDIFVAVTELREAVTRLRAVVPGNLEQKARNGALGDLRKAGDDFDEAQPKLTSSMAAVDQAILEAVTAVKKRSISEDWHLRLEVAELTLFSQTIARLRHDWYGALRRHLPALPNDPLDLRAQRAKLAANAVGKMDEVTDLLVTATKDHLTAETAPLLLDYADSLARHQRQYTQEAQAGKTTDVNVWKRLARGEAAMIIEVKKLEEKLIEYTEQFRPPDQGKLQTAQERLQSVREVLKPLVKVDPPEEALLKPAQDLQKELEGLADVIRPIASKQYKDAAGSRRKLEQEVGDVAEPVRQLLKAIERQVGGENKFPKDYTDQAWDAAIKQLQDRRKIEMRMPKSDPSFQDELNTVRDELENLRKSGDPIVQILAFIRDTLVGTELIHHLYEVHHGIQGMEVGERRRRDASDINTRRAREWDWITERLGLISKEVRTAGLPGIEDIMTGIIDELLKSEEYKIIEKEMIERKQEGGSFGID